MSRLRVGVIGAGAWGRNHVRTLAQMSGVELTAVCDLSAEIRDRTARAYPGVFVTDEVDRLLERVDAVVVASTARTHGEFGLPQTHRETIDELANSGFAALGIERFSRVPGMTWQNLQADDRGAGHYRSETFAREEIEESRAALDWLSHLDHVDAAQLGVVGFCGGGIRAIRLAALDTRIRAVAAFYPPPSIPAKFKNTGDPSPDLLELSTLPRCRLQIHFGTEDYIVKAPDIEALAARIRDSGAHVEVHEYAAAGHAFYDRTDASAYRPQAAATARAEASATHSGCALCTAPVALKLPPIIRATTAAEMATTAPTEMSRPRTAMTSVMPSDTTMSGAARFRMSMTLP